MNKKTEVIEHDENLPAELTPLSMIAQVIENPDFDVDKLDKMMQLQERWEDRRSANAFNAALSGFQSEVEAIPKETKGAHDIRYAKLDKVMQIIQPVLAAHSLSVRFSTDIPAPDLLRAFCTVSHVSGHSETSEMTIPTDPEMRANASQKMGSANSYAKRYALSNALNLAFIDVDYDGNEIEESSFKSKQAKTKARGGLRIAAKDGEHAETRKIWNALDNDQRAELWESFAKADQTLIRESLDETKE